MAIEEPVPWFQLSLLFISLAAHASTMTVPFPFLPFMVKGFGYSDDAEVGYYAGMIASAMFVGRTVASFPLGKILDSRGRRPVMLGSLLGLTVSMTLFGFATSLTTALVARFAAGIFSGVVMSVKVMLSELCPIRLQATASSILTVAWGLGLIIGSSGGGLLAEPADKYDMFNTPLWRAYPYLLPSVMSASLCMIVFVPAWLYLPETLPSDKDKDDDVSSASHVSASTTKLSASDKHVNDDLEHQDEHAALVASINKVPEHQVRLSAWDLLQQRDVRILVLFYGLFSFAAIGMEEMHSLFCATPVSLGGLGWSTSEIGANLGVVGVVLTMAQTVSFPILEHRFKLLGAATIGAVAAIMCTLAYPTVNTLARGAVGEESNLARPEHSSSWAVWMAITIVAALYKITAGWVFCSVTLLFNNSVHTLNRGAVNGIGLTFTAFCRIFGPFSGGSVFAWSISKPRPFPFNRWASFVMFAAVFSYSLYLLRQLSARLNRPK
eukprot:TRINITY_DN6945_c0_g1_i1.p1 TRINITY_DN6945_c0_g1~~TRINITY_DN6945_c0_g1_i1.p1  ORF type:complete len:495 (+),score=78.30 TRINITY_DN6945_c0_g1_i1:134-1618(+)